MRKLDVDGGTVDVLIVDLSLCKRGLVVRAPVYRLESLVDIALLVHLAEHADLSRLELGLHGQIRIVPLAEDT